MRSYSNSGDRFRIICSSILKHGTAKENELKIPHVRLQGKLEAPAYTRDPRSPWEQLREEDLLKSWVYDLPGQQ